MSLLDKIRIAAMELNILLRGAAMDGIPVAVDHVERVDPITETEYTEVVIGTPSGVVEDDPDEGEEWKGDPQDHP